MAASDLVLIVDFGSQYTQLIARRIRESRVYCEIVSCTTPLDQILARKPRALVLSGGPSSVYAEDAPPFDPALLQSGLPTLGICYGVQILAHRGGGHVARADRREYGPAEVTVENPVGVFAPFKQGEALQVWMSHGDRIEAIPPGFVAIGSSPSTPFCAVASESKKIYGLQFHPGGVPHTPGQRDAAGVPLRRGRPRRPTGRRAPSSSMRWRGSGTAWARAAR